MAGLYREEKLGEKAGEFRIGVGAASQHVSVTGTGAIERDWGTVSALMCS